MRPIQSVLLFASILFGALSVPLEVMNWADVSRNGEVVTQGVCLPAGAVYDLSTLRITDGSGATVPAQFHPLSRWWFERHKGNADTPSVKWVLCDFQASVAASNKSNFFLKDGGGNVAPSSPVRLTQEPSKLSLSNGVLKFTVSKTVFNLFDELWYDSDGSGTFEDDEKLISSSVQNGGFITAGDWSTQGCVPGTIHSSANRAPVRIVVEEEGPMKVVLRVEGRHYATTGGVSKGLYDYQVFITLNAGEPFADIQWGVTNLYMEGIKPGQTGTSDPYKVYVWPFTDYRMTLNFNLGATQNYTILGSSEVTGSAAGAVRLIQKNNVYTLTGTAGGVDAGGAVALSGGGVSIQAAIRHFAPNVPKGITVEPGKISLEWFPDTGTGTQYWLDPYTRKNHRFRLQFATGSTQTGALIKLSKEVNAPLRMLAAPQWYQKCRAWDRGFGVSPSPDYARKAPASWTRTTMTSNTPVKHIPDNDFSPTNWYSFGQVGEFNGGGDHWNLTSCFYDYLLTGNPSSFEYSENAALYFNDIVPVQFSWYDDPWVKLDWFLNAESHLAGLNGYHGPTNNIIYNGDYVTFPGWVYHRGNVPDNGHMSNLQQLEYFQFTGDHATEDAIKAMGVRADAAVNGYSYFTCCSEWGKGRKVVLDSVYIWAGQQRYIGRPGIVMGHAYEVTGDERFFFPLSIPSYSLRNFTRQNPSGYMAKADDRSYMPSSEAGMLNLWKVNHPQDTVYPRSYHSNDFMMGIGLECLYQYYKFTKDEEIRDALILCTKSTEQRAGFDTATGRYTGFVYSGWADYIQEGKRYSQSVNVMTPDFISSETEALGGCSYGYLVSGRDDFWKLLNDGRASHAPFAPGFDKKAVALLEAVYRHDSTDILPPAAVTDLSTAWVPGQGVRVSWTATGDNGSTGTAAEFQIKYGPSAIVDVPGRWNPETQTGWPDFTGAIPYSAAALIAKAESYKNTREISFWAATNIKNEPIPEVAGTPQSVIIPFADIATAAKQQFAMVVFDSASNVSPISNVVVGVVKNEVTEATLLDLFALFNVHPNPFNPSTTIKCHVPNKVKGQEVAVEIFDLIGRRIHSLMNGKAVPGAHTMIWNGCDSKGVAVASGMYFVRMTGPSFVKQVKMALVR